LENRSNEISDYLDKTIKRHTLSRLLGQRVSQWRRWNNDEKPKYRFDKNNLREILQEIRKDEVA
jgi:hypothetical protein